uniref:Si:dkey-28n18.9 n=1 Tax=Echeneis naucrates TaxID=173247 RepID=A0A665X8N3_ECHNA
MQEVEEVKSALSVHGHNIRVTDVLNDEGMLTFLIVSQKLSGTGEYHVDRTYDDFEWLQQLLFSQEEVPGIQGVIVSTLFPLHSVLYLTCKPAQTVSGSGKSAVYCFLGLGEWQPYRKALETFLQQVASHNILNKNKALEIFLTSTDPPGRQRARKNIFNWLSQAVEEMRKEGHKDVDEFFQTQRDLNLVLTGHSKNLDVTTCFMLCSYAEIALACGHFSAALHLCVEAGDDPDNATPLSCLLKMNAYEYFIHVAENNVSTLGLGLDLESRYLEAEKEMLFRRTCKLVELETAKRNAEKAKSVKKAMEEVKKAAETEFDQICGVAKKEVKQPISS